MGEGGRRGEKVVGMAAIDNLYAPCWCPWRVDRTCTCEPLSAAPPPPPRPHSQRSVSVPTAQPRADVARDCNDGTTCRAFLLCTLPPLRFGMINAKLRRSRTDRPTDAEASAPLRIDQCRPVSMETHASCVHLSR